MSRFIPISESGTDLDGGNRPPVGRSKEDGMQVFLMTVTVLAGLFILYTVVRAGSMSDSDRQEIGHGPKGQGR